MYTSNDREPTEGLLTLTLTKSQRGWIARKSVSASKWITFYHRRPKPSPFWDSSKHGVGQGDILNANGFLLSCSAPHKLITRLYEVNTNEVGSWDQIFENCSVMERNFIRYVILLCINLLMNSYVFLCFFRSSLTYSWMKDSLSIFW